jgi:hypothetical protein
MSKRVPVSYKFPSELKGRLEQAAAENNRSVTAELVYRLEESLNNTNHVTDSDIHSKLDKIYIAILEQRK